MDAIGEGETPPPNRDAQLLKTLPMVSSTRQVLAFDTQSAGIATSYSTRHAL